MNLRIEMLLPDARPLTATFSRGQDDLERNGDYHCLWHATASGSGTSHVSTLAISGPVRVMLQMARRLDEAIILDGLVRLYRRSVGRIIATPNALVVAGPRQLAFFEVPSVDVAPLETVVHELEQLIFTVAQVPKVLSAAANNAAEMTLPLPAAVEWTAAEPLLRVLPYHWALKEFFDSYLELRSLRFYGSAVKTVTATTRRTVALGALALHAAELPALPDLSIVAR